MQQDSLQRAFGRLEGKVEAIHEDILEIKKVVLALDGRTAILERRNWSGGLNGRTWTTIIVAVIGLAGTIASAVAMVAAAQR